MPKFHLPIINNQMLADVFIWLDNNKIFPVKALFDTGATNSCICAKLAEQLNLVPTGKTSSNTANGVVDCNTYKIRLGFPFPSINNDMRVETPNELMVAAIPEDKNRVWKLLVGMDIIQQGILIVDKGNYIFSL